MKRSFARIAVLGAGKMGESLIDGLLELEEGGLRVTLIKALVRASDRAGELIHD